VIDNIAVHFNSLSDVVSAKSQGGSVVAIVIINNENFTLRFEFDRGFPIELPKVYLVNPSSYGFLPHVCWRGLVCYNDGEGVSMDTEQPLEIAEYALTKVMSTLSIEKSEREDLFFNEFEGYWNRQSSSFAAYSFLQPEDSAQIVKVSVSKKKKTPLTFFQDKNDIDDEYHFFRICKEKRTQMNAVYLPLERYINPPLPGDSIDIGFLDEILRALSIENKAIWDLLLSKNKLSKKALHLLVSQPRPQGGKSLYGLTIPYVLNWLSGNIKPYNHQIIPLSIDRHTPDYLLERSGGNLNLEEKNVAIIGCGSIGGRMAELLIMSGVKKLTLIDNDIFSADNLFRHVLDSRHIGHSKVKSLAKQLKSRFPYVSIETKTEKITGLSDFLINHNLIIDASGNPTLGRELNISHRKIGNENVPLFLTVWTEPLGLGGHVVMSDGKTLGCLHCLFHRDNTGQLSSIFNFVEKNQIISKNLTGCGGAFTPFSALDAVRIAEIATRMIVDAFSLMAVNESNETTYQWWRGDDTAAIKSNIKTTPWYLDCKNNVDSQIDLVFSEGCPVCRQG